MGCDKMAVVVLVVLVVLLLLVLRLARKNLFVARTPAKQLAG